MSILTVRFHEADPPDDPREDVTVFGQAVISIGAAEVARVDITDWFDRWYGGDPEVREQQAADEAAARWLAGGWLKGATP